MTKLKPCPFCGNEVEIEIKSYSYSSDYHSHEMVIVCEECDFEFPKESFKVTATWDDDNYRYVNDMSDFDSAIELWNTRVRGE